MTGNIPHWAEFLFDGVGGAALLGFVGFAYRRWRSARDSAATTPPIVTVSTVAGDVESKDKSVAFGHGTSVQGSPIVYGSHNTFNFSPQPETTKTEPDEAEEEHPNGGRIALGGLLAALLFVVCLVYFLSHDATPAQHVNSAAPSTAKDGTTQAGSSYSIGIQYGQNISSISVNGSEDTDCTEKGITCLGEQMISGKTISVPLQHGSDWSRMAVLVNFTDYGTSAHVAVSTQSDLVGLSYVDHRDGMFHKQVDFVEQYPEPIEVSQRPSWFPLDIVFRKPVDSFPITIAVSKDDQPIHTVTTRIHVIRPLASKITRPQ